MPAFDPRDKGEVGAAKGHAGYGGGSQSSGGHGNDGNNPGNPNSGIAGGPNYSGPKGAGTGVDGSNPSNKASRGDDNGGNRAINPGNSHLGLAGPNYTGPQGIGTGVDPTNPNNDPAIDPNDPNRPDVISVGILNFDFLVGGIYVTSGFPMNTTTMTVVGPSYTQVGGWFGPVSFGFGQDPYTGGSTVLGGVSAKPSVGISTTTTQVDTVTGKIIGRQTSGTRAATDIGMTHDFVSGASMTNVGGSLTIGHTDISAGLHSNEDTSTVDVHATKPNNYGGVGGDHFDWSHDLFKPIVLDLNGNGISITEGNSSNQFYDFLGDGYRHRTAWAGIGDGVLAIDADGDGQITERKEIVFGDWDPSAKTDMEALRSVFDSNNDGKLDASDAEFSKFRVVVTNADGTTTVKTLAQAGVKSINLIADATKIALRDGSSIDGMTTYTKTDNSIGKAATVTFATDAQGHAIQNSVVTKSPMSAARPTAASPM